MVYGHCLRVNIAAIKYHDQSNLGGKGLLSVHFDIVVHH